MLKCEIRADNTLHIEGYVNAVERDSKPIIVNGIGKCVEQVRAGVFGAALAGNPMVEILENHDRSRKLGSTADGVLSLSEDSIGLRASADISDADIVEKARAGQLKGWSFGFIAKSHEIEQRAENIPRRVITGMALTEVSLIDGKYSPCYSGTLVEVRAADTAGETEVVEFRADEEVEIVDAAGGEPEPAAEPELDFEPDPDYSYYERAMKLLELRYNPYHDPSNGRFCSGGGGGGGGVLYVGKGQKGKGMYVVDVDRDDEYEKWKAQKSADIYSRKFATPEEYKKALAEKYNGITDVSKVKTAKDVSDFINYDTQSQYYASSGSGSGRTIKSTWQKGRYGTNTNEFGVGEELSPVRDAGFSSNGTTVLDMPKGYGSFRNTTRIFDGSFAKLEKAGIRVGRWIDDKYMVTKKKGARTKKWLEGLGDNTPQYEQLAFRARRNDIGL